MPMSNADRQREWRERQRAGRPVRPYGVPVCGESSGYKAHQRANELQCEACRSWMSEYQRQRRAKG